MPLAHNITSHLGIKPIFPMEWPLITHVLPDWPSQPAPFRTRTCEAVVGMKPLQVTSLKVYSGTSNKSYLQDAVHRNDNTHVQDPTLGSQSFITARVPLCRSGITHKSGCCDTLVRIQAINQFLLSLFSFYTALNPSRNNWSLASNPRATIITSLYLSYRWAPSMLITGRQL